MYHLTKYNSIMLLVLLIILLTKYITYYSDILIYFTVMWITTNFKKKLFVIDNIFIPYVTIILIIKVFYDKINIFLELLMIHTMIKINEKITELLSYRFHSLLIIR